MKNLVAIFLLSIADGASAGKVQPCPLKTCNVSDEEWDASHKPVSVVQRGREVRVCCRSAGAVSNAIPENF
jgi:hypothetical protein